jgi:hypothetical protein
MLIRALLFDRQRHGKFDKCSLYEEYAASESESERISHPSTFSAQSDLRAFFCCHRLPRHRLPFSRKPTAGQCQSYRRRGLRAVGKGGGKYRMKSGSSQLFFFDAQSAAKLLVRMPLEAWMGSDTCRPLFEPLLLDLVGWTAESNMPSWRIEKGSDDNRTDLFEWNRAFGDLLARTIPFVTLDVARNIMLKPFMARNEEALSIIARFADMVVRRHVFDAAKVPENAIPLLDDCA